MAALGCVGGVCSQERFIVHRAMSDRSCCWFGQYAFICLWCVGQWLVPFYMLRWSCAQLRQLCKITPTTENWSSDATFTQNWLWTKQYTRQDFRFPFLCKWRDKNNSSKNSCKHINPKTKNLCVSESNSRKLMVIVTYLKRCFNNFNYFISVRREIKVSASY